MAKPKAEAAIRVAIEGRVRDVGFREATVARAGELGVMGWVRHATDGDGLAVHAEGDEAAVGELELFLHTGPDGADVTGAAAERVKPEGHEQFAIRGVSAGRFVVREHHARTHHFDVRLEVGATMRSWAVPKGPSLDPAVRRMAIAAPDHDPALNLTEGAIGAGRAIVWDRGHYEQGGRVPWPEAFDRGHAVFVLHGEKLRGGFALQRTGGRTSPRWLLVKRVDDEARPGSDVIADRPGSVISGRALGDDP